MQKRIKLQKMLIGGLAGIIAILIVGLLVGRNDTVPVIIANSAKIDLTKPLDEQLELLSVQKMARDEFDLFGGTLVTSAEQIKGAKLKFPLQPGSPIILSALTKGQTAGQFAANTPEYHTVFKMPEIIGTLPPGIQAGDKVDIDLLIATGEKEGSDYIIGPLLQNVEVSGIEETTLYLMVSQREYSTLSLARQIGSFVVQLPGKKQVGECTELTENIKAEKEKEITDFYESKEYDEISKEEQDETLAAIELKYDNRFNTIECVDETDKPTTITSDSIIKKVKEGKTLDEVLRDELGLDPANQNIVDELTGAGNVKKDDTKNNETDKNETDEDAEEEDLLN